jgi:hypothetical protein
LFLIAVESADENVGGLPYEQSLNQPSMPAGKLVNSFYVFFYSICVNDDTEYQETHRQLI